MLRTVLLVCLGLIVFAGVIFAARFIQLIRKHSAVPDLPGAASEAALKAWVDDLHEAGNFNGVVSVRKNGRIVLRHAVGRWGEADERLLTDATPMRLASLSKPFTATAVLKLVDAGMLDLDTPVGAYLPECDWPGVTVRRLLNHSSGVENSYPTLARRGRVISTADAVDYLCSRPLADPPGTVESYNNSGYVLLAGLVERVTGQSFERALRELVLTPLDMPQSRVWNRLSMPGSLPEVAPTFNLWDDPPSPEPMGDIDGVAGDGAVHASLNDLERFAAAWSDGRVLPVELHEAALRPGVGRHGLSWVISPSGAFWHNGWWLGARSYMWIDPETGSWIIIVDNGGSFATDNMAKALERYVRSSETPTP